jgi:hypothetical protein
MILNERHDRVLLQQSEQLAPSSSTLATRGRDEDLSDCCGEFYSKQTATPRLAGKCGAALCQLAQADGTDGATLGSSKTAPELTVEQPSRKRFIMLQASEIQKRFTHLEQTIEKASQACHADATVPKELMDCVDQLDKKSEGAKKIMESKDENRMRQWIDDLEEVGDRAEQACQRATNVNAKVKSAVTSVHAELSDLKKQLH